MAHYKGASASSGGGVRSSREPVVLTEQQWATLAPLVPGADSASRGRLAAPRKVVEGILYAIRNGLGMQSVPPPYPSGSTLYRRFTAWTASGEWGPIWAAFLNTLSPAERRQWEAAARQRPGGGAESSVQTGRLQDSNAAAPQPAAGVEDVAAPRAQLDQAPASVQQPIAQAAAPAPAAAETAQPRYAQAANNGQREHVVNDEPHARSAAASAAETAPGSQPQLTLESARERVSARLGLSAAESEIVRRRIDDHGVAAALSALDEVEGRLATGAMRGVGGTQMSAFEIWVCAVGLARRPVERPRAPRPERNDRHDGDRDRRKRQWRKAP